MAAFDLIYNACKDYTMTSRERMLALYNEIQYISKYRIDGDIVECGVWKGGSMMLIAMTLVMLGDRRKLWLYDTYEGMPLPDEVDKDLNNIPALDQFKTRWCYSPIEEVKSNMEKTGYPLNKIVYVKGKVEETIPKISPNKIALLRLDTDWYSSTQHELENLYPRLEKRGVLIVDDYGHWKGSRKAVDEYFGNRKWISIDYTGIMLRK